MSRTLTRRRVALAVGSVSVGALLVSGCTSNTPAAPEEDAAGGVSADAGSGDAAAGGDNANDASGETVTIGFSAPAADHGWMAAITRAAQEKAAEYDDVELVVAEGTNDVNVQISQIETFINDGVDAIVLLPFDGAALTEVATQAMEAGITVVNVDREFSSPFAARTTVLGDNYGMGVSAGTYICERLGDNPDAVVAEIAGIDSLPLTQDRSQGFEDALSDCGLDVDNRVAADFTVQGGQEAAASLLQAAPEIDAIWNHDDDQGVGVLAAIDQAGRDEFFMVGGAGSANVMREIQEGGSVVEATVIYPSTQAADGIALARLIEQNKDLGDLVSSTVPREVQLYAPVVTADNVEQYLPTAFES
ncbi:substrate-binding domain-containing protein [Aquipuribacter nitratireducens]|uniref:Substrate-binding domain-containing protein n=1 Tax=Aquipuribacter nitratireducens TaxID=650104 RepID=A0ABW0GMI4_9MICO